MNEALSVWKDKIILVKATSAVYRLTELRGKGISGLREVK